MLLVSLNKVFLLLLSEATSKGSICIKKQHLKLHAGITDNKEWEGTSSASPIFDKTCTVLWREDKVRVVSRVGANVTKVDPFERQSRAVGTRDGGSVTPKQMLTKLPPQREFASRGRIFFSSSYLELYV